MRDKSEMGRDPTWCLDADITEATLQAYVDDMLPPRRRLEVEEYISDRPSESHRIRDFEGQNRTLHDLFDSYLALPLPTEIQILEYHLAKKLGRKKALRTCGVAAAAVTLLIAVVGGGYFGAQMVQPLPFGTNLFASFHESSDSASARPSGNGQLRAVQASAVSGTAVTNSTSTRATGAAPDLADFGFALVATRVVSSGSGNELVQFVFESDKGQRIMLYLSQTLEEEKSQISLIQEGPVSVLFWSHSGRTYSMVGEVDRQTILAIGEVVSGDWIADSVSRSAKSNSASRSITTRRSADEGKKSGSLPSREGVLPTLAPAQLRER